VVSHSRLSTGVVKPKRFDVIAVGQALFQIMTPTHGGGVTMAPAGGAVTSAVALARRGLTVGLVTVVDDDPAGRGLVERVAAAGVDTEGVHVAPRRAGLLFVDRSGATREVGAGADSTDPLEVPDHWSSRVLLVSGLSPVVAHAAALCKAARAARRSGAVVVLDVHARWHLWAGHDGRAIRSILREADVVRLSTDDAAVLGVDPDTVRALTRPRAVLVMSRGADDAWATGPFGHVVRPSRAAGAWVPQSVPDAFTTEICEALARAGEPGDDRAALWERALERGHRAVWAESAR
jgi:sugar/nucleoside kinase (ribokinase family)